MGRLSGFERAVAGFGAAFALFTGGYFLARTHQSEPWQVTASPPQAVQVQQADVGQQADTQQEETPESLLPGEVIDLNTASVSDLDRLPSIGEKRAQAIVAYREEHGPFATIEDVMLVSGIGEGIFQQISDYLTVS